METKKHGQAELDPEGNAQAVWSLGGRSLPRPSSARTCRSLGPHIVHAGRGGV